VGVGVEARKYPLSSKHLELKMRVLARARPSSVLNSELLAPYDETSPVPAAMSITPKIRRTGDSVSFTFENDDGGGPDGTDKRNQAVEFLTDQRCE
jgi:hypothetical protein